MLSFSFFLVLFPSAYFSDWTDIVSIVPLTFSGWEVCRKTRALDLASFFFFTRHKEAKANATKKTQENNRKTTNMLI